MVGGSNGYRAALVTRQLTLVLISSLPGTAGLQPFIFFSTSCNSPSIARCNVTRSRLGACRAPRATLSRTRFPVGVRALAELGCAAALQATSAQSEKS